MVMRLTAILMSAGLFCGGPSHAFTAEEAYDFAIVHGRAALAAEHCGKVSLNGDYPLVGEALYRSRWAATYADGYSAGRKTGEAMLRSAGAEFYCLTEELSFGPDGIKRKNVLRLTLKAVSAAPAEKSARAAAFSARWRNRLDGSGQSAKPLSRRAD